jgi:hypothetical protein
MVASNFNYGVLNAQAMPAMFSPAGNSGFPLQNIFSGAPAFSPLQADGQNPGFANTALSSSFGRPWMRPHGFNSMPVIYAPVIVINNGINQFAPGNPVSIFNRQPSLFPNNPIFNSRPSLFPNNSLLNPIMPLPAPNADQLWNRLDMLDGQNGYIDFFTLGYLFSEIDTTRDGILDQNEVNAWTARNGNSLNLSALLAAGGGRITLEAFRNYLAQRDLNHDNQWSRDEFDGRTALPGSAPALPNPNPTPSPFPPVPGRPSIFDPPNQQAPTNNNPASQAPPGNQPALPNPSSPPQPPANPAPQPPASPSPPAVPKDTQPQNPPTMPDKDANASPPDAGKKQPDAKKPGPSESDQRFQLADKADNKEGKEDGSIDLVGLIGNIDQKGDGIDDNEYKVLAQLLGLKTAFGDIEKDKTTSRADKAAVLKAAKEGDEDGNDKLSRQEFDKMNPPAKDGQPAPQNGKDAGAQPPQIQPSKPKYFDLNRDRMHGVTQVELTNFLSQFAGEDGKLDEKELGTMIMALGWDKARFAQTFLKDLQPGMDVTRVVDAIFRSLDHDNSGGLVRGELGDMVEGGAARGKHRRHRRRH